MISRYPQLEKCCNGIALVIVLLFCLVPDQFCSAQFDEADLEFFENRVRPILSERCSECHQHNDGAGEGGLSIGSRAAILAGGDTGPAIVPGSPEKSLLIDAVHYRGYYEMPPDSKLPAEEIEVLEEWVRRKAPWPNHGEAAKQATSTFDLQERREQHWAWQPISEPAIPAVSNSLWPLDPIDNFILAKLENSQIKPAVATDLTTWIRRVYFDLIGLPPSYQDVQNFVNDDGDDAHQKVVDRLLASPQFGERWARHWMDLTRYAETYGHEFDYPIQHAFKYRDYLIRAFNADVPYDDFIREHLAGDLISQPRLHPVEKFNESVIGTGFWFLGEATHAPVDVKGDEAGRIDNQIDVMTKTFLGMTVACARCHDHKFDAISDEDYYALTGFLQSSRRELALLDPQSKVEKAFTHTEKAAQSHESLVTELIDFLAQTDASQWLAEIQSVAQNKNVKVDSIQPRRQFNLEKLAQEKSLENENHPLHLLKSAVAADTTLLKFKFKELEKNWAAHDTDHKAFLKQSQVYENFDSGIPEDWFVSGWSFRNQRTNYGFQSTGHLTGDNGTISSGLVSPKLQGVIRSPTFEITHDKIAFRAKGSHCQIRLVIDGYIMNLHNSLLFNGCYKDVTRQDRFEWIVLDTDVKNYKGHNAYLEIIDHGNSFIQIDEIRFVNNQTPIVAQPCALTRRVLDSKPANQLELQNALATAISETFSQPPATWNEEQFHLASLLADHSEAANALRDARKSLDEISIPDPMPVIAMTDGSPEDEHLFIRGNSETLGPVIPRRFLSACTTSEDVSYIGSGRLQLADQIASPQNPLTSRVISNRIWHHLIGQGIVSSVDNFGVLGERPSHPELLDHLAISFSSNGWSIKKLIRRIVLSQTYAMRSNSNAAAERIDPENKLLYRANIKRLPGETIRDSMLKISSSLDPQMFGPSVGVHLTDFMQGRGRPRAGGPLDGDGRRSVYIEVRRNFLPPLMLAFDTPIPFNTIGKRHQSNVPAQALILMNDPFVVEQAKNWAKNLIEKFNNRQDRITAIFSEALGRLPTNAEVKSTQQFLSQQGKLLELSDNHIDENLELWADVCHIVFNMKEFIYIQ